MEDLEDAINSLNEAMNEHFGTDRGTLAHLLDDNIHTTLKDIQKELSERENLFAIIETLDFNIQELTDVMKAILKIQARALKWQEMSQ